MNRPIREAQRIIQESFDPRPYEIGTGRDVGVFLIHGFTASATETRPLADYIGRQTGWLCKGILLPGHGEKVEALENTTSADWLKAATHGYADLAKSCRRIFLAGVSMGAVLCCHIARRYSVDSKIRGLILLAPAFGIKRRQLVGVKVLKHVMRFKNKGVDTANSYIERKLFSYTQFPLRKVGDMLDLGREAFNDLPELHAIPTLMLAGKLDATVSLRRIRQAVSQNPWIRYREFDKSKHVLTVEPDREEVFKECLKFMRHQVRGNEV